MNNIEKIYYKYIIGKKLIGNKIEDFNEKKIFNKFIIKSINFNDNNINNINIYENNNNNNKQNVCYVAVKDDIIIKILYIK
jgi:hypothetical protein